MNPFGNWKEHDVAEFNSRTAIGKGLAVPTHSATDLRDGPSDAPESDLHDKVEDFCRERGWYYIHSRLDRRTTVAVGTPDWLVAKPNGQCVWLELKRRNGKATPAQQAAIAHLRKLGHRAEVVDNWEDAKRMLES